ncbi:MAG: 5'/3'-nucleotidase SurE [Acidimicrobiales bacterium]
MRRGIAVGVLTGALAVAAGCSGSSGSSATTAADGSATTVAAIRSSGTTQPTRPLRILVTNDDGVGAAGIDAVTNGLTSLPGTEVVVVAPATNQSGTGGKTTAGEVTVRDATTASGVTAKAVEGYPADTITVAIDRNGIPWKPDLVVSGINAGQNLGPFVEVSGTVGAARAAVARGVPALAASQGLASQPDFPWAVTLVNQWVEQHRAALLAGTAPAQVDNLNVPTCLTGTKQELVSVPVASDITGIDLTKTDCPGTGPVANDAQAFAAGHPTLSQLGAAPTSTTAP